MPSHVNAKGQRVPCKARKRTCPLIAASIAQAKTILNESHWGQGNFNEEITGLIESLSEKYGQPLIGRTRAVFFDKDKVYKVFLNDEGMTASSAEYTMASSSGFIPTAECEFDYSLSSKHRIPVLVMERVKPFHFASYDDVPEWVSFVDGGQVGHNAKGELVAYDL